MFESCRWSKLSKELRKRNAEELGSGRGLPGTEGVSLHLGCRSLFSVNNANREGRRHRQPSGKSQNTPVAFSRYTFQPHTLNR